MQYHEAMAFLSRYTNYERELRYPYNGWAMNLSRVRAMLTALGDPDRRLTLVQVAGTKGKGSTAAMIESMARAAGYSTGLFTSPHLTVFRERIRLRGEMISEEEVGRLTERLLPAAAKVEHRPDLGPLTFFEILTVLGLLAFDEAGLKLAVLETGLGGRYDATTVTNPAVAVLTHVSLDHMDILGNTITAIATEKSFIIKPGRPAVIAPQTEEAYAVFHRRCQEVGAPEVRVAERYTWERLHQTINGQAASFHGPRELLQVSLPLLGAHQLRNAAAAITAIDLLAPAGFPVSDAAVKDGLAAVVWPARFQRIRARPDLILDGAHNVHSAACLRETLLELYPGRRIIAVLGLAHDKDVEGFVRELGPVLQTAVVTHAHTARAEMPARIEAAFAGLPVKLIERAGVLEAMNTAVELAKPEDVIIVTGSFYVVSEALAWDCQCS